MNPVQVWVCIGADVLAGTLYAHRRGRVESAAFNYSADYLASPDA